MQLSNLIKSVARIGLVCLFVVSSNAPLRATQDVPPGFSLQPVSTWVFEGQPNQFSVGLTGSPTPTCQWQASDNLGLTWTNLTNTSPYAGVTTTQLTVSNTTLAMSGTQLRCLAGNSAGTLPSSAATLSVAVRGPQGTPTSGAWTGTFAAGGGNMSFDVTSGTSVLNVNYSDLGLGCSQSYGPIIVPFSIVGGRFDIAGGVDPGIRVIGDFTSTATAVGTVSHTYSVGSVYNGCRGRTYSTGWAAAFGPPAPAFLVQPVSQAPAAGQRVQFTVMAKGTPSPAFLWQMSTNGGTSWSDVSATSPYSGHTTPTLTILGSGVAGLNGVRFRARAQSTAGTAFSDAATLTSVAGPTLPLASVDSYATAFNSPLIVGAPGVLGNDNANGGGALTAVVETSVGNGTLSLAANGGFSYVPNAGFVGVDTFTYRASTTAGPSTPAVVSITVSASNAPVAPSNFRVVAMTGNRVSFAWTLPTSGPAPSGIQLEGGVAPGSVLGAIPLGVSPATTVQLPSGSFFLRLRTNANGVLSAASNEVRVHVNVPVAPSQPTNLLGLVNGSALNLAWTPTFTGGEPTGAILDVTGTLSASLPLGAGDMFSYPAVPPGTYTFSVRQTGAGGASAASSPVTLTFPGGCSGAPQPASNFLAYKLGGILYLSWDPPASGAAPAGYLLNVTGAFVGTLPMASRSFSVTAPPGTFTFTIVSFNGCGNGAASATQTVSFP